MSNEQLTMNKWRVRAEKCPFRFVQRWYSRCSIFV